MPLRKKNALRNRIIVFSLLAIIIALTVIYFQPTQHLTEIVLFP